MGQDTEELKRNIETTRAEMSGTIDAIGDRVIPGRVMERNKNKVRAGVGNLRESVMGTAHDAKAKLTDTAGSVGESASTGIDSVKHAPDTIREQTQGAPLITGAIAFGVGFLIAAAFPPSASEKEASAKVMEALEPVKEQLTEAAHEVADHLKEPAKEAAANLKSAATESAQAVTSAAQQATETTTDQAKQAVDSIKDQEHNNA
ncbi:MAG: DUF3618 domain-containing protein [Ilumatobacteraceae bacterium]